MNDLEAQLASLRPRADRLDRERLMFLAGQAAAATVSRRGISARRVARQLAAMAAVALVAAGLTAWLDRPEPRIVERVVYVPVTPPQGPSLAAGDHSQNDVQSSSPSQVVSRPIPTPRNMPYFRQLDQLLAQEQQGAIARKHQVEGSGRPTSDVQPTREHALSRRSLDRLFEEVMGGKSGQVPPARGA